MPERLYFTDSDEANELIATDPMALLVGFALDQQVTVQKAFAGPLAIKERLGTIDAEVLAVADLEPVFRERPAVHRFPGSMATATAARPGVYGPTRKTATSCERTWARSPVSAR
jgi:uncharacterized HhH-GPD family protein